MGATSAGSPRAAAAASRLATTAPPDLRNMTVLLVEDDPGDQRLFASQLRAADLQLRIEIVGSLVEALDRLADAGSTNREHT